MAALSVSRKRNWSPLDAATLSTPQRQKIIFYFVIPVILGFLIGWPQAGRTAEWPKSIAVAFWIFQSLGAWWASDIGTRVTAAALRPMGAPLWLVLILGFIISTPPTDFFFIYLVHLTHTTFTELPILRAVPDFQWTFMGALRTHTYGFVIWPTLNLACFYFLRMPRYGYEPSNVDQPQTINRDAATEPLLLARLPARLGKDILALQAEHHYLRVHTALGNDLILYRLSDAVRELHDRGIQVHRGFWVAKDAVKSVSGDSVSPKLILTNGLEVPVSRSFRLAAKQAGLL